MMPEPPAPPPPSGAAPSTSAAPAVAPTPTHPKPSTSSGGGKKRRGNGTPPTSSPADGTPSGKASKGLRHFSMRVCKKVEEKGHTSYNEVADELVREFVAQRRAELEAAGEDPDGATRKGGKGGKEPPAKKGKKSSPKGGSDRGYDEKNIRRRVYDALNVLMAMDIISKEKKQITWKGLPSNAHHDLEMLQRERALRVAEVQKKQQCLQDLLVQNICFKNLVRRNEERKRMEDEARAAAAPLVTGGGQASRQISGGATAGAAAAGAAEGAAAGGQGSSNDRDPPPGGNGKPAGAASISADAGGPSGSGGGANASASSSGQPGTAGWGPDERNFPVPLPFIVVNTSSQAVIKCDMNPDRTDVMFDFSLPFEINDDNEILKRLQLDKTTLEDAEKLFPRDLFLYARQHHLLADVLVDPAQMPSHKYDPYAAAQRQAQRPGSPSDAYGAHGHHGGYGGDGGSARSAYSPPRNAMPPYGPPSGQGHGRQAQQVAAGGGGSSGGHHPGAHHPGQHRQAAAGPAAGGGMYAPPPPHAVGGGGRGYERE